MVQVAALQQSIQKECTSCTDCLLVRTPTTLRYGTIPRSKRRLLIPHQQQHHRLDTGTDNTNTKTTNNTQHKKFNTVLVPTRTVAI